MKFSLNYYYDPSQTGPTEAELPDWFAFDEQVKEAGVFVYAEGFHAATEAQTLSLHGGQVVTQPGGVASAGDILAGFVVLEVPDMNAALEWAKRIPTAKYGKVEVRPVVEM